MRAYAILASLLVLPSGCSKLLGIDDPVPATPGDGARPDTPNMPDAMIDSSIDAPPPCAVTNAFGNETAFPIGGTGLSLAVGRLDAGIALDVAIATGTEVVILHGDGAGNFGNPQTIPTAATGVVIDTFNIQDARDDLVMWRADAVIARLQDAANAGQFLAEQPLPGTFTNVTTVMVGTFDPNPDVVVDDDTGLRLFTSLQGIPGTFSLEDSVGGAADELVFVGTVDGGGTDVLLVNNGTLSISRGSGASFGTPTVIGNGVTGRAVGVGDFDTDNLNDIMIATAAGGKRFLQQGGGTFAEQPEAIPGIVGDAMHVTDINADTAQDIAVPGSIVMQCPSDRGVFTQVESLSSVAPSLFVDVNANGTPDLLRLVGTDLVVRLQ